VPAQQRRRPHEQRPLPGLPWQHTAKSGQQRAISLRQLRTSNLALQHPQLVAEQQNLDLLLPLGATPQHEQQASSPVASHLPASNGPIRTTLTATSPRRSTRTGTPLRPRAAGTTAYGYAADNRLKTTGYSDSTPGVTYTYDNLNPLTGVSRGTDTFSYSYDAAGNITNRTYPDNTSEGAGSNVGGPVAAGSTAETVALTGRRCRSSRVRRRRTRSPSWRLDRTGSACRSPRSAPTTRSKRC
jgi:YD repeat-containing protein